jgi:hypothetical protein
MWWACQDLNLGPHPYQKYREPLCADPFVHPWGRALSMGTEGLAR